MKILVLGTGSIGVYLGCTLYSDDHDVYLLGKDKLKKLHDTILINNKPFLVPSKIYELPENETYDYIFITSKLYDLQENLKKILNNNIKSKYLVSIQNGIVDESVYKPFLGESKFCSISIFEGFRLLENQLIVNHSPSGWKTEATKVGKNVANMLTNSGINCYVEPNLEQIKAEKMVMNCAVNLLSAVSKKTFYEIYRDEKLKKQMDNLFYESYDVLSKHIKLSQKEILMEKFYKIIANMAHYSSTYQDAISGKRTEVGFLNAYIIELGKKHNVSTPHNEQVLKQFKEIYN